MEVLEWLLIRCLYIYIYFNDSQIILAMKNYIILVWKFDQNDKGHMHLEASLNILLCSKTPIPGCFQEVVE